MTSSADPGGSAMPEPDTSDEIVLADGVTHAVKNCGMVKPATVVVLYDVQLSGA